MKQLIFRLNQQQFRNNKYKKKDVSQSTEDYDRESSWSHRGTSAETPIEIDDGNVDPALESNAPAHHTANQRAAAPTRIVKLPVSAEAFDSLKRPTETISVARSTVPKRVGISSANQNGYTQTREVADSMKVFEIDGSTFPERPATTVRQ